MHGELLKNHGAPAEMSLAKFSWGEEEHMKWALRYFKFKHITEIMPAHVMCDDDVHLSSQRDNLFYNKNAPKGRSVLFLCTASCLKILGTYS